MKVVAINGSPRREGNTALALRQMAEVLEAEGIATEIIQVGNLNIRGCLACGVCARKKDERCVVKGDQLNEILQKMKDADAIILGSPVYYAGIAGTMKSFCDRAFYVAAANGGWFEGKVGTAVVSARRGGTTPTFSGLNYYFQISNMLVAGSNYWNNIHGGAEGEAVADEEGIQTVRNAAKNIAWLLKLKEAGSDVAAPAYERGARTNFIR